jgi:hypothetical protein
MVKFRAKVGETEYPLELEAEENILSGKSSLEQASNIPAAQQKWIYQGRILADSAKVGATGIVDGHVVHVLRSASSVASVQPAVSQPIAPNTAAAAPAPVFTLPPPPLMLSGFDNGMRELLTNSEDVIKNATALLMKILGNIIQNPMEEKYRKIKSSNPTFTAKLQSVKGGIECMKGAGFIEQNGEWVLLPSGDGWNIIVACHRKLEVFNAKVAAKESGQYIQSPSIAQAPTAQSADVSRDLIAMQEFMRALAAMQSGSPQPPRDT